MLWGVYCTESNGVMEPINGRKKARREKKGKNTHSHLLDHLSVCTLSFCFSGLFEWIHAREILRATSWQSKPISNSNLIAIQKERGQCQTNGAP